MLINMKFLEHCLAQNVLCASYAESIFNSPTSLICAKGSQVKKSLPVVAQRFN